MTDAMTTEITTHGDAELLAAFVDGQLDREQLEAVTTHLASCEECRAVIGEAVAFQREEKRGTARWPWMGVAAAVVIAVIAYPGYRGYRKWESAKNDREIENSLQSLYAAFATGERPTDGRFSKQMTWADHSHQRGGPEDQVPLEIQSAALQVIEKTEGNNSPAGIRAHTIADAALNAALKKPMSNILAPLQKIPMSARDAGTWNDIAAAALAANDYSAALDAVQHALQKQPKMPEALFNRAMILYNMNDSRAPAAWNDYLAVDPSSRWAVEARGKQRLSAGR